MNRKYKGKLSTISKHPEYLTTNILQDTRQTKNETMLVCCDTEYCIEFLILNQMAVYNEAS